MSAHTARSARVEIAAPVAEVFAVVAAPAEHHRFDASGSVGSVVTAEPPRAVGDVFTMEMTYREGEHVERYRTDNTITRFDEPHCVEWAVAPHGEAQLGWRWRYEFEAVDGGDTERTLATLTYDWAGTPEENVRRFGVPLFDENDLAASLALLAAAVQHTG